MTTSVSKILHESHIKTDGRWRSDKLLHNILVITPKFQKTIRVLVTVFVLVLEKSELLLGSLLLVTDFVTLLMVWQVRQRFQFRFQKE